MLEIRAKFDGLLVGKTTLDKDNMRMGLPAPELRAQRVAAGRPEYPLRVIVSNSGRINPELRVFQTPVSPVLIFSTSRMPRRVQEQLREHATLHLTELPAVNLHEMMRTLRSTYRVRRLLCEGGAGLFRSLLEQNLVDELNLTFSPRIFGGARAPTLTGLPGAFLPSTTVCRLRKMEVIGGECFLNYRVVRGAAEAPAPV